MQMVEHLSHQMLQLQMLVANWSLTRLCSCILPHSKSNKNYPSWNHASPSPRTIANCPETLTFSQNHCKLSWNPHLLPEPLQCHKETFVNGCLIGSGALRLVVQMVEHLSHWMLQLQMLVANWSLTRHLASSGSGRSSERLVRNSRGRERWRWRALRRPMLRSLLG